MPTQERRYADFVRISGDWFWETGTDGRFTFFSQEGEGAAAPDNPRLGTTRREGAVQTPENLARLDSLDLLIAAREPFRHFVYQAVWQGAKVWISTNGEPRLDEKGAFAGYRGTARDVTEFVAAREELERKSRALDAILHAMPDGVQMVDPQLRTVAINDRLFEVMGVTRKHDDGGQQVSMFTAMLELAERGEYGEGDPEKLTRYRIDLVRQMVARRQDLTYERQLKTGRWIEGRLRPLEDGSLLSIYRDITEAKQQAAEVERQSALLRTLFDNFPGGIAVYDGRPGLVAWNERYADTLGADRSVVKAGASPRDVLASQIRNGEFGPYEDVEKEADRRFKALRAGRLNSVEWVRRNGRAFEMRRAELPDGGSLSIYLDTTERARAERELKDLNATLEQRIGERTAALAENERFLRAVIASVPGLVYRCANDRDWTMEFVSAGCRQLLGIEPEALTGGNLTYNSLVHPHDREALWRKVQSDFAEGDFFEQEYRVQHADGTWRWV